MKKVLKGLVFLIVTSNFGNASYAQQNVNPRHDAISKELFSGSYFTFYSSYYASNKAKIVKESGEYSIKSTKVAGVEGGANFFINFNKNYSIITGIHAGASGRNLGIFISKSDFDPALKKDLNVPFAFGKDYAFYLSAPVWFEKRWVRPNFNHWNADIGVNIRYHPGDVLFDYFVAEENVNDQTNTVLLMDGLVGNNIKPWINYNIAGGYSWFLSNYNFLRLNLIANFSATKIVKFTYSIDVSGKPQSFGTYSSNLSYVGLSLSYILTGANKRLLKFYQNNLKKDHSNSER
jgi:hypothetical protein